MGVQSAPRSASEALTARAGDVKVWHPDALCLEHDPNLWFPLRHTCKRRHVDDPEEHDCDACFLGHPPGDNHADAAKAVCARCPVAPECMTWACLNNESGGIYGGVGNDRRRRVSRILRHRPDLLARVVAEELAEVRRVHLGGADARPKLPRRPCDRCDHWVPAGTWPPDRNGPGAQCGRPSTYARGCRCELCQWAAALRGKAAS